MQTPLTRLVASARRLVRAAGFDVVRAGPVDAREDPRPASEIALEASRRLPKSVLVAVPTSTCRSGAGHALDTDHPIVAAFGAGVPTSYEASGFPAYYASYRFATACGVMGAPEVEAPGFAGLPAAAFMRPWVAGDPATMLHERALGMEADARQYGETLSIEDGMSLFGPVTRAKGEFEMRRFARVYESIRTGGYRRTAWNDGDITAWLLVRSGGAWCVQVNTGQHRAIAGAALGMESLPIRLPQAPVRREDVEYWPQVAAGRITAEAALGMFDRVMAGQGMGTPSAAPASAVGGGSHPARSLHTA